jgi:TrmH family RNA methyltransferase
MSSPKPPAPAPGDPNLVDSLLHPEAVLIRQLLDRSERDRLGKIIVDDEENILEALRAGVVLESVYHTGDLALSEPLRRALPAQVAIRELSKRTGKKLFETEKVSRLFALAKTPPRVPLEALTQIRRDVVVLEDVEISGNIGAIVRTSMALGVGAIVLLNTEPVDVFDRRLIRASRGHVFALPIVTATTEELVRYCSAHDLALLVTAPDAETLVGEIASMPRRLAIVFGSEKHGCSPQVLDAAAVRVKIPMNPRVESLNVSAAAGITLYNRVGFNRPTESAS